MAKNQNEGESLGLVGWISFLLFSIVTIALATYCANRP